MVRVNLVSRAEEFARKAHAGQIRKYTGEPYVEHCRRVAELVAGHTTDEEIIAAAWLHDTVEDCGIAIDDLRALFGDRVATLVGHLTDISRPSDGNRATRKALDREHLRHGHPDAKTVKCADLIDNTQDISKHDQSFAKVYLAEKELLLPLLKGADPVLWEKALLHLRHARLVLASETR